MKNETCPAAFGAECPPATCHGRCAIEVIDELLSQRKSITGEQADLLLDLRWQLSRQDSAEEALRLFATLRLQLEPFHYLAFFRMRRWLEHHIIAQVQSCPAAPAHHCAIKLDAYCIEAVRRHCLCRALAKGTPLLAPRLTFAFRTKIRLAHAIAAQAKAELALTAS